MEVSMPPVTDRPSTATNRALWAIQALLALLFLFTGTLKLVVPLEALKGPILLPGLFLRFIGVCEVLGAIGLFLPAITRIRPALTALAAAGLVIIMVGATTVTLAAGPIAPALMPFVVGVLAGFVAYGRWRVAPIGQSRRPFVLPRQEVGARAA
jgi:hypothetical protein